MTDRELLQQALDVMLAAIKSGDWKVDGACDPDWVIEAIKARLAKPKKEWVGLTDAEAMEIEDKSPDIRWAIIQAEAKLKEKNT